MSMFETFEKMERKNLEQRVQELLTVLKSVTSYYACRLDDQGRCHEHVGYGTPCAMGHAREVLGWTNGKAEEALPGGSHQG